MAKRLSICEACHLTFHADAYNGHHQKFCTRPECVRQRKRRRQRESYARRYAEDAKFRDKERTRCAEGIARRRARVTATDPPGVPVVVLDVLTGLVAQVTDISDPVLVRAAVASYGARGRRMALMASSDDDSVGSPFSGCSSTLALR